MLNNSTIWRRLKKIARSAKINPKKIHPHAWRHLFAKQCKENGIDLDELADILGHKDINTTAIYTKTSMKEKKNKLERIRYQMSNGVLITLIICTTILILAWIGSKNKQEDGGLR